jgi:hypothetical protein
MCFLEVTHRVRYNHRPRNLSINLEDMMFAFGSRPFLFSPGFGSSLLTPVFSLCFSSRLVLLTLYFLVMIFSVASPYRPLDKLIRLAPHWESHHLLHTSSHTLHLIKCFHWHYLDNVRRSEMPSQAPASRSISDHNKSYNWSPDHPHLDARHLLYIQ